MDCANFFFERSFVSSLQFRFPIYGGIDHKIGEIAVGKRWMESLEIRFLLLFLAFHDFSSVSRTNDGLMMDYNCVIERGLNDYASRYLLSSCSIIGNIRVTCMHYLLRASLHCGSLSSVNVKVAS